MFVCVKPADILLRTVWRKRIENERLAGCRLGLGLGFACVVIKTQFGNVMLHISS